MKRNGKELIAQAMSHKTPSEVPWVPFAGVHAGFLKGYKADEVLQDGTKLLDALLEVNEKYMPDGQPVCFDLQLEAEILGCKLYWAEDSPPSVMSHPLQESDDIPDRLIGQDEGRLPLVLETARKLKDQVGEHTAIYGLLCGPFTLASHLRGSNIFMDMALRPDYVKALVAYCNRIAIRMADLYIAAGCDVIAPVDPLISQISPKHFDLFCAEGYSEMFKHIREKGRFSSFFVCGNAIKNIEVMCKTDPDCISVDENLDMVSAKQITDRYDITIAGNIPLTTIMLYGNQQDNMKFVVDLMDKFDDKRNLIVSPGCDMPYNVPVANGIAATQAVHDPKTARNLVANYQNVSITEGIDVDLPDYEKLDRPLVELFSLDPVACAACTYMLAALEGAKKVMDPSEADWGDYRYNKLEDIARMQKVGVKNLPSIYINGKLVYDSIIPSVDELVKRIRES